MRLIIISEAGYGRTYSFGYRNDQNSQTDKRPRLLLLGKWRHPSTRNILLAGINLNYLTDEQLAEIRKNLKAIIQPRNLKSRYWKGRQLLPDIFQNAYRTYDKDFVGSITKDTLKFWPSEEELNRSELQAQDAEAKKKESEAKKLAKAQPGLEPEAPLGTPGDVSKPETALEPIKPAGPDVEAEVPIPIGEPGAETLETPEVPEAPEDTGETPRQRQQRKRMSRKVRAPKPASAKPVTRPTSAQRRKKQAEQIKGAIERTKPQPKPVPPTEIRPALNMFKSDKPKK